MWAKIKTNKYIKRKRMTKLGFVEQLTELPEFPSGSVEHKMCKKIAELTQVSFKTC